MRRRRVNPFFLIGLSLLGLLLGSICMVSFLILIGFVFPGNIPLMGALFPDLTIHNGVVSSNGTNAVSGLALNTDGSASKPRRPDFILVTATPLVPPTPIPTLIPSGPKRILVDISEQHLFAYQGNQTLFQFVVSTGANDNTPTGQFQILDKIPDAYSDALGFKMPQWLGFSWIGDEEDGFHALPILDDGREIWGSDLGKPITTGCVVLAPKDAQQLYNWADVGTAVVIQE